jgi:hypothetical protein
MKQISSSAANAKQDSKYRVWLELGPEDCKLIKDKNINQNSHG